jgi:hypothetical protein
VLLRRMGATLRNANNMIATSVITCVRAEVFETSTSEDHLFLRSERFKKLSGQ